RGRQRHREQGRERRARLMQLAHRGAARGAVAQVRADLEELLGRRLAVDDRRQQRQPALALGAALDPRVAREERAPPLGDATVDLRKPSGKTGAVAPIPAVLAVDYTGWATTPPLPLSHGRLRPH